MAVLLVTYDLRQPGRNYQPVHAYLQRYTHCKQMESVWLLDTTTSTATVRDDLIKLVDANDRLFIARLSGDWGSFNYGCAQWLNQPGRGW
jgi:hypothetical protein